MSISDWALALVTALLESALLVAVLRARRYRYCYAFVAYLVALLGVSVIGFFFSAAVYRSWVEWAIKEYIYALTRLAVVAEVVLLVFRALPRARFRAVMVLLTAAAVLAIALSRPYDMRNAYALAVDLTGRFSYPTVWTLIAALGLVAWHRVPLHHLHKALLHGMLWLLVVQFFALDADRWGQDRAWVAYRVVQCGVYLIWLRAAWVADAALGADEVVVIRYLQPWRAQ
jgi:hypothetical protein